MSKYDFEVGQGMFAGTAGYMLTVTTAAATGFSGIPATCVRALFTVEGDLMRYRYDGTAPTATTGHLISSGGVVAVYGKGNLANFKVIGASGSTGITLFITFEVDSR